MRTILRNVDQERLVAVNKALIIGRLLDERYYPAVSEALRKGKEGKDEFGKVCVAAGVPSEMIMPIWDALLLVQSNKELEMGLDW